MYLEEEGHTIIYSYKTEDLLFLITIQISTKGTYRH
jgi:hypothetical protein